MYKVLNVCRYAINYSNDNSIGISNLKLQKILYFIQAYFLITGVGEPCFSEEIEAWDFGPVVPVAYHEYKQYGATNIPKIFTYVEYDPNNMWNAERKLYNSSNISTDDKHRINTVINEFANYSATYLVTLTHRQSPWQNAYRKGSNRVISVDSIREYFA